VTHQFPPLPSNAAPVADLPPRSVQLPDWPRLMNQRQAAAYLSIGTTLLRDLLPPKKVRGRSLWDRHDLDRFADAIDGQPLDPAEARSHSGEVERAWLDKRAKRKAGNG
jgi:hypothetical protein